MTTLGVETEGIEGARRLPRGYLLALICFTVWTVMQPYVTTKQLQIVAGRWVRAQQMSRATSGLFHHVWLIIVHRNQPGPLPEEVVDELLAACCLAPLYVANLRLETSEVVTCSDASMQGGGVC